MNRILVAFDYFSPAFPLVNNQNFNRPLSELEIDNGTYEFTGYFISPDGYEYKVYSHHSLMNGWNMHDEIIEFD